MRGAQEQNIATVRGEGNEVVFKQIAGLIARRIVFNYREGDRVERGQRVGLIKFGSRMDVVLPADADIRVKTGQRVKGGSSVLAAMPPGGCLEFPRCGDRQSQKKARLRRGMFLLPSLFTAMNIGAGYFSITQTLEAVSNNANAAHYLDWAAIAILLAIPFDSLDGRIARMTNTCSDFGKELDSLADVITFGVAPSLLAFVWGFHFLGETINPQFVKISYMPAVSCVSFTS